MNLLCVPKQELESPYQGALRLYSSSSIISVDVVLGRRKLVVPAAFVNGTELAAILDGENYAGVIGGMFFITRQTPKEYRYFAAFHELAEHAALRGFDVTGLAKHFQAVVVELGYAKTILSPDDFSKYLEWRKDVERTKFFSLKHDGLVDRVAERMYEIFESLPKHLTYRRKRLVGLVEE